MTMASSVIMAQVFNASMRNDGSGCIQEADWEKTCGATKEAVPGMDTVLSMHRAVLGLLGL